MMQVMLVEDDPVDVMAIQRIFKKNQVINPLHLAEDGLKALFIIDQLNQKNLIIKEILLILLDFHIPKMNGLSRKAKLNIR